MKKIFLAILFLTVFVSGCSLKNKNAEVTPTENKKVIVWETYTSSTLGFSVEHPSDWKVTFPENSRDVIEFNLGAPTSSEKIVTIPNGPTKEQWAGQFGTKIIQTLSVDGQQAILIDDPEFSQKYIGVNVNGKLYIFTTAGEMLENGMIEKFRFIQ